MPRRCAKYRSKAVSTWALASRPNAIWQAMCKAKTQRRASCKYLWRLLWGSSLSCRANGMSTSRRSIAASRYILAAKWRLNVTNVHQTFCLFHPLSRKGLPSEFLLSWFEFAKGTHVPTPHRAHLGPGLTWTQAHENNQRIKWIKHVPQTKTEECTRSMAQQTWSESWFWSGCWQNHDTQIDSSIVEIPDELGIANHLELSGTSWVSHVEKRVLCMCCFIIYTQINSHDSRTTKTHTHTHRHTDTNSQGCTSKPVHKRKRYQQPCNWVCVFLQFDSLL